MRSLFSVIHDWMLEEYQLSQEEVDRRSAINSKINALPPYKIKEFKKQLLDDFENKGWLVKHGMKVNPDVQEVKEVLYEEKFKQYVCLN